MTTPEQHGLAVWEVQYSCYDESKSYRPTGKRWVLAADVPTALRLVEAVVDRDGLAVHSIQKRTGDLWGAEKLIVDWDTLDALREAP